MSDYKRVITNIELYRAGALLTTITPEEVRIVDEVTEALGYAEVKCAYTSNNAQVRLADKVDISIAREGETLTKVFTGDVTKVSTIETGKITELEFLVEEEPLINIRTRTMDPVSEVKLRDLLAQLVAPLVEDNVIPVTISPNITSTISFGGCNNEPILSVLQDVCIPNTVDFHVTYGGTLYIYHKELDTPLASYTLDQSVDGAIPILETTTVADSSKVRNTVTVRGEHTRIEPDGQTDYWTDSTVGWTAAWYNADWVANPVTPETVSPALKEGSCYLKFFASSDAGDIAALSATIDLGRTIDVTTGAIIKFVERIYGMKSETDYTVRWLVGDVITYPLGRTKCEIVLYLDDTVVGYRYYTMAEGGKKEQQFDIRDTNREAWWNFEYGPIKVNKIAFHVIPYDTVEHLGRTMHRLELNLDWLHFAGMEWVYSARDLGSIEKYGVRPYEKDIPREGLDSEEACLIKAAEILGLYSKPEEAIQSCRIIGDSRVRVGEKSTISTSKIPADVYYIRKVEHNITELEWMTELSLSKSRVMPPEKTREQIELDMSNRLRRLEKDVASKEHIYPARYYTIPHLELPPLVDFDDSAIDWDKVDFSTYKIPGSLALRALSVDSAVIANAAITNLKILDGAVTFPKVDTDFPFQVYGDKEKFIATFEALTGYDLAYFSGEASFDVRKNALLLYTGTLSGADAWIMGYPAAVVKFNPRFKARVKIKGPNNNFQAWLGLRDDPGDRFFEVLASTYFYYSAEKETINTLWLPKIEDVFAYGYEEEYTEGGIFETPRWGFVLRKASPSGALTTLQTLEAVKTIPSTRQVVQATWTNAGPLTIEADYTLIGDVWLSKPSWHMIRRFQSRPILVGLTIPAGTTWTVTYDGYWDSTGGTVYFYYGRPDKGGSGFIINHAVLWGSLVKGFNMRRKVILCGVPLDDYLVTEGIYKYDPAGDDYVKWKIWLNGNEYDTGWLVASLEPGATELRECDIGISNFEDSEYTLTVYNYTVQEDWEL